MREPWEFTSTTVAWGEEGGESPGYKGGSNFGKQPKRVKSLNSGQNLSHTFFGLDFCVLLFFQLL